MMFQSGCGGDTRVLLIKAYFPKQKGPRATLHKSCNGPSSSCIPAGSDTVWQQIEMKVVVFSIRKVHVPLEFLRTK